MSRHRTFVAEDGETLGGVGRRDRPATPIRAQLSPVGAAVGLERLDIPNSHVAPALVGTEYGIVKWKETRNGDCYSRR
jgi:hypothetical protein